MVIPLVVDKNDDNGNYVSSSEAKLFVNDEPIARTLTCKCGRGQEVHHNNMVCVAMRGRNPEHPTDRTPGIHTEQRLEMNKDNLCLEIKKVGQISNDGSQYGTVISDDGLCSTLTAGTHGYANNCISVKQELVPCKLDKMPEGKLTSLNNAKLCDVDTKTASTITSRYYKGIGAHKDNMLIEIKQATKEGSIKCKVGGCYDASYPDSKTRRGSVQDNGDTVPTLTASSSENINYVETVYRIRKLTPKECGRLMGYCDFDIEKTLSVNSNSQVYRQFGNAIVKQVLMAIFLQLGIKGLKKWNERTPEEREKLVMGSVYDKEFE